MAENDNSSDNGEYVVSRRGLLRRAPVGSPDPESIFRAETTLNTRDIGGGVVIPEPSTDAYSPYAANWKEFDKLQKSVKGNKAQWVHWVWGVIFPVIGLFDRQRVSKTHEIWLIVFAALLGLVGLIRTQSAKERFAHWPCPRCGAKWPGTKTEKDPQCSVCGLKLHQLVP